MSLDMSHTTQATRKYDHESSEPRWCLQHLFSLRTPYFKMSPPSDLGLFSRLPPELRLCIWDLLTPPAVTTFLKEFGLDKTQRRRKTLAIMRTSQRLHDEICDHLYGDFRLKVRIPATQPGTSWLSFELPRLRANWIFPETDNTALEELFGSFPFHKVHITIHLTGEDYKDRGLLVLLWIRLNRFIDFLATRPPAKGFSLVFSPGSCPRSFWLKSQKHKRLSGDPSERTFFYDHEALAFQLFRLEYCQNVNIVHTHLHGGTLDWAYYDHVLSFACPPKEVYPEFDDPKCSVSRKDRYMVQATLEHIQKRMIMKLNRASSKATAQKVLALREWEKNKLRLEQSQREWKEKEKIWKREEMERARKRTEFWLLNLLSDEDQIQCECDAEAHEFKTVYFDMSYIFCECSLCRSVDLDDSSEPDGYHLPTRLRCRRMEPMMHFICG